MKKLAVLIFPPEDNVPRSVGSSLLAAGYEMVVYLPSNWNLLTGEAAVSMLQAVEKALKDEVFGN